MNAGDQSLVRAFEKKATRPAVVENKQTEDVRGNVKGEEPKKDTQLRQEKQNKKVKFDSKSDFYGVDDRRGSRVKGRPTLRVTRKKGRFRVEFQPIRINKHEKNLAPVVFVIPDEWSDDGTPHPSHDSDDSDLDIEYDAPASFMKEPRKKPLVQVMKQYYDYTEVEQYVNEQDAIRLAKEKEEEEARLREAEKEREKEKEKKLAEMQPSLVKNYPKYNPRKK